MSRCAKFCFVCEDERHTTYLSRRNPLFVGWLKLKFLGGVNPKKSVCRATSGPRSMCQLMAPTEECTSDVAVLLVRQFG